MSRHDYRAFPVLYVDDDPNNLFVFEHLLEEDFAVEVAESPVEALRRVAENDYAVVLADRKMPGITGDMLLGHVAELRPSAVRILVTAYPETDEMREAVRTGKLSQVVAKPWNPERLADTLRSAIDRYLHGRDGTAS
jgi:CheY-like chemotaxis protein